MTHSGQNIRQHAAKAPRHAGITPNMMTPELPDSINDHYKGMTIRICARRSGEHAWRCSIRIYTASHRALRTVCATLLANEAGVSRQSALALAFIEAMNLCDGILEKKRV